MSLFEVRALGAGDRGWIVSLFQTQWGSAIIVSRGRVHRADELAGFVAEREGEPVGLVIFHIEGTACEIVSLNSRVEGQGIGSTLVAAVREAAIEAGCRRLWLVTTNDNLSALSFYRRKGIYF